MAELTKKFPSRLVSTSAGGFITTADEIALKTQVVGAGTALEYLEMTQSVADAIADIENRLNTVQPAPVDLSEINQKIADIESSIEGLSSDKIAYVYSSNGDTITTTVKARLDQINTIINQFGDIDAKVNTVQEAVSSIEQSKAAIDEAVAQIKDIEDIARDLSSSFDSDAKFQIMSQTEYDKLTAKNDNTLYFCY